VDGWRKVTDAVHSKGGKIFLQIMHCGIRTILSFCAMKIRTGDDVGRSSHILNMPSGSEILAPSAVPIKGQMYTDQKQMQDFPVPKVRYINNECKIAFYNILFHQGHDF